MRDQSHGGYEETTSEKEVMEYITYVPEEIHGLLPSLLLTWSEILCNKD